MQKIYLFILSLVIVLIPSCNQQSDPANKKELTIGFGPSSYADQFNASIKPLLEQKGYSIKVKIFSQNNQMNPALTDGSVDATVNQSLAYAEFYNQQNGVNIVKLADTASAPQSLRSKKHQSLAAIKDGTSISIPNDPVNEERAARILEKLGLVTIKPDANVLQFSLKDITILKPNIILKEIDSPQAYRSMEDVDFAIVNGNYVVNAHEKISDGLVVEQTPAQHVVIVTILAANLSTQWAKDLKAAYESKEFENYIKSHDKYAGFIFPSHWQK